MRLTYLVICVFLLSISAPKSRIFGQTPQPLNEAALLWEISGNGLSSPSYVFGTIHMIPQKDFFLSDATKNSLERSGRVVFEINLEKMADISSMLPMMMQAFMKKDTTLKDLLAPEEYQLVKQHFQQLGLPMFLLDRIKPMFLTAMDPQMMTGSERESITSYEMELMEIARNSGKTIDGLETAAFQMSMFDSIPYRIQARMLLESIRETNPENADTDGSFDQMVEMYKSQDIEAMQQLMQGDSVLASYDQVLLIGRNKNWIPAMIGMMHRESCFFAVGAGHLGGTQGVLQLLREKGFIVKALR